MRDRFISFTQFRPENPLAYRFRYRLWVLRRRLFARWPVRPSERSQRSSAQRRRWGGAVLPVAQRRVLTIAASGRAAVGRIGAGSGRLSARIRRVAAARPLAGSRTRRLVVTLAAVLVIGLLWRATRPSAAFDLASTVVIGRGEVANEIFTSGKVVPGRATSLVASEGLVAEVYVQAGDRVAAGDPLLRVAMPDLERDLEVRELDEVIAKAQATGRVEPAAQTQIAAQRAALAAAQADYATALVAPRPEDVAAAEAELQAAQAEVHSATAEVGRVRQGASSADLAEARAAWLEATRRRDALRHQHDLMIKEYELTIGDELYTFCPGCGDLEEQTRYDLQAAEAQVLALDTRVDALGAGGNAQSAALAEAKLALANAHLALAQARYDLLLRGSSPAQLMAAAARVAQEQLELAQMLRPSGLDRVSGRLAIEQARLEVERLRLTLEQAVLRAPIAGVITAVYVDQGETAQGIAVEMLDDHSFQIVVEVDEFEVGGIAVGQEAMVTVESLSAEAMTARVTTIVPSDDKDAAADEQGATYQVFLVLGAPMASLRQGLSTAVTLTTAERAGVVLAPNTSLHLNRQTNTYTAVWVAADGETQQVREVKVGLHGETHSEITAGLEAGDRVLSHYPALPAEESAAD